MACAQSVGTPLGTADAGGGGVLSEAEELLAELSLPPSSARVPVEHPGAGPQRARDDVRGDSKVHDDAEAEGKGEEAGQ